MENLKEIEGRYFKKCNVVILPTNKPTNIVLHSTGLDPYHKTLESAFNAVENIGGQYQHLYITSNDQIKEGDWCYEEETNTIFQAKDFTKSGLVRSNEDTFILDACNKIIATTDKSLMYLSNNGRVGYNLPQPSQSFIEKYCELGGIEEVMVEYEDNSTCKNTGICKLYSGNADKVCIGVCSKSQLKTDSHNTITIKPIKDNWSRKELDILFESYREYAWVNGSTKAILNNWKRNNL